MMWRRMAFSVFIAGVCVAISACASNRLAKGPVTEAMDDYIASRAFKAYAIQVDINGRRNNGNFGFAYAMANQAAANSAAIGHCLTLELDPDERCVVYAEGNNIVFMPSDQ